MQTIRFMKKAPLLFTAAVLMVTFVSGCGLSGATGQHPEIGLTRGSDTNVNVLWSSGVDYVQLVARDVEGAPGNEHPADISPEEIEALFAALQVRKKNSSEKTMTSAGYEVVPVFNDRELAKVSRPVSDGLGRAGTGEDVAFSVSSNRKGWFTKETLSTTGRVFVHEGKLNIIFRELHVSYRDIYKASTYPTGGYISDVDKRRNPLLPGSRTQTYPHAWSLSPASGIIVDPVKMQRDDWVALEFNQDSAISAVGTRPESKDKQEDPDMENAGQTPHSEVSQLPYKTASPASVTADRIKTEVRQRLSELKELYDDGLVPESLYLEEVKKNLEKLHD